MSVICITAVSNRFLRRRMDFLKNLKYNIYDMSNRLIRNNGQFGLNVQQIF